ncbi:sulfate reduction electron transfer complex DsrMKJOP subunit DsrO [Rhodoferax sp.]|uniref:sulfate reduction electron transfer complex DsrMKJOP subunit DsrO n=1 Tax=Rhodoferax sp. TaxID=50421 RepID=UPI002617CCF0|nr:4Fe-4S dicluster domain-containing protein [Rhodoferax sp.]MDD2917554.1 4Fe-4S dicluster domain-containing protein [Rhodoferax sp.]
MKHDHNTPQSETVTTPSSRRGFLGVAAAGMAGILLAPGVRLFEIAQAAPTTGSASSGASSKVRWGMLIDSGKCASGCTDCVTACNTENGLSGGTLPTDSQWIRKLEIKDVRTGHTQSLPMMCQHCAEPPCVDVCPTGASFKRADGIVLVDKHICIGCRYCIMACPYKARSFVHEPLTRQKPDVPRGMGTAEACTLCVHRVDRGEQPACVSACADAGHGAIIFGNLNDPESEISKRVASYPSRQIRENLNLNTGVRYIGI